MAKATPRLTWSEVTARRLERHGLAERAPHGQLAEQVGVICGAHAQVITAAEWSIAQRVDGVSREDIQAALWNEHSLIKTFGPRGTVHLLAAADLPLWTGALAAVPSTRGGQADALLTPEQTDAVVDAIGIALADAELTVDELTEALVRLAGPWAGEEVMPAFGGFWPRWRQATATAAHRGVLCFGPNRGRNVTYTNPRRWLSKFQPMDGPAALAGVVERYLVAYGPATPQHFAQWLAAPRGWAADLFDSLAGALEEVQVDGERAWAVAGDTDTVASEPRGVRLLPYFDAYSVGCHPRGKVFPGRASERALAGSQAGNFPVLLIDGLVAGVWHQRRSGRKIEVTVEPLHDLTAAQRRELDEQVERLGAFLGGTPALTIGPVKVGPHA